MAKRNYLALLAILLLAFALRVYRLDSQSLWYDEAVTAQVASQGIGELTRWTADDIQPPLYYYAAAGWLRVGRPGRVGAAFSVGLLRHADRAADVGRRVASVRPGPQRTGGRPGRGAVDRALAAVRLLRPGSAHVHAVDLPGAAGRVRAAAGDGGRRLAAKDEGRRRRTKDEGRRTANTFRLSSFVFRPSNGGSSSSSLPPPCSTPTTSASSCCWLTGCVSPSVGWLLWRGAGLAGGRWPLLPLAA